MFFFGAVVCHTFKDHVRSVRLIVMILQPNCWVAVWCSPSVLGSCSWFWLSLFYTPHESLLYIYYIFCDVLYTSWSQRTCFFFTLRQVDISLPVCHKPKRTVDEVDEEVTSGDMSRWGTRHFERWKTGIHKINSKISQWRLQTLRWLKLDAGRRSRGMKSDEINGRCDRHGNPKRYAFAA